MVAIDRVTIITSAAPIRVRRSKGRAGSIRLSPARASSARNRPSAAMPHRIITPLRIGAMLTPLAAINRMARHSNISR